jgi:ArsR family transcriptional regulator, arsenate/arsenite/antimonite-responsive transcriptional repressor
LIAFDIVLAVKELPLIECCTPLAGETLAEEEVLELERLFQAIADKQRIRILNLLLTAEDAVCVCEFVPTLGLSQATVSYHLKQLTEAGLLVKERRSYYVYYHVAPEALERLRALLAPSVAPVEAV